MSRGPLFGFPLAIMALVFFFALLLFLFVLVQVGAITMAFAKLGLTPVQGFLVLMATLFGSTVNLPVWRTGNSVVLRPPPTMGPFFQRIPGPPPRAEGQLVEQIVAVNVGGCLIPCLLSAYFISQIDAALPLLFAVAAVTAVCYKLARPVPGVGIGIPMLIPPLATALVAILLAPPETSPHLAYVSGSLGTILGADILHLARPRTRRQLNAPILSIGGAGTFDGIFITGIIAVLLA